MQKFFKDCITVANGEDYDIGRVLWILCVLLFLIYQGIALYQHQPFIANDFGFGVGSVLAAGGAALGFKKNTEPE